MFAETAVLPAVGGQVGPLAAHMAQVYQMSSPGNVRGIDEWSAMMTSVGFAEPFVAVLEDPYGLLATRMPARLPGPTRRPPNPKPPLQPVAA